MKRFIPKGLNVSVTIKNNYAQIIISIGILLLCLAIGVSFIKGNSTITVSTAIPPIKDADIPTLEELQDLYIWEKLCTNHVEAVTNKTLPKK